jgi:hypothetical protein
VQQQTNAVSSAANSGVPMISKSQILKKLVLSK